MHVKEEESEFVSWVKAGDEISKKYLFEKYSSVLYRLIYAMTCNDDVTLSLLKISFKKIFTSINSFQPVNSNLHTWMCWMTKACVVDYLYESQALYSQRKGVLDISANHIEAKSILDLVHLIGQMPLKLRAVAELFFVRKYKPEEMSILLGLPIDIVHERIEESLAEMTILYPINLPCKQ